MKVKIRSYNNMSTVDSLGKEKINKISNKINKKFYKKGKREKKYVSFNFFRKKTEHLINYTLNPDVKEFWCIN